MSPFQVVYGYNPSTPLDLTPLPQTEFLNLDGANRADQIKKLHLKAKERLEKTNEQRARAANKGRKEATFEVGDWVWLHMRPERFPNQRSSKLSPRGDGPFKIISKINDNAYKLDLPGEYQVSNSFNVTDLAYFDAGTKVLRSKPQEEGGSDEDIEPPSPTIQAPSVPSGPMTRSRSRALENKFNIFLEQLEHEGLIPLDQYEAIRLTPSESSELTAAFQHVSTSTQSVPDSERPTKLKLYESSFQTAKELSETGCGTRDMSKRVKTGQVDPILADDTKWALLFTKPDVHLTTCYLDLGEA